jgi:predicted O-linked N-acetylglucosamine transferase (SPINDLY family)
LTRSERAAAGPGVRLRKGQRQVTAGKYADALTTLGAAVSARPNSASAHYWLARAFFFLGEIGRATAHLRKSLRSTYNVRALEFLATIAPFDSAFDHRAVKKYRTALYTQLAASSTGSRVLANGIATRKVLRIGYVSSFFQDENWMKPVWALIDHHDRQRVQVHLFSDAPRSAVAHLNHRRRPVCFHDMSRHDNAGAARLIAQNRIDVLVDLNGFSNRRRLPLYVIKPAPVLVAWFNVLGTTGMPTFDAVIGDEWVAPDGEERWFVEPIVRLPMSNQTFAVTYPVPDVHSAPCLRNGFVTFGCLTSMYKLNPQTIHAWSEILRRAPQSRLVLANATLDDEGNRAHLSRRFAALGIGADRLTLFGGEAHRTFLEHYEAIDLALDTFPYGCGTTAIEALWQGVPMLTVAGDRWIARQGVSILSSAGLDQFIHRDVDAYIDAAVRWATSANTPAVLNRLRTRMRKRLKASAVCDGSRLAGCMEAVYRDLWTSVRRLESRLT